MNKGRKEKESLCMSERRERESNKWKRRQTTAFFAVAAKHRPFFSDFAVSLFRYRSFDQSAAEIDRLWSYFQRQMTNFNSILITNTFA